MPSVRWTAIGFSEFCPSSINSSGQVAGTAVDSMTGVSNAIIWQTGFAHEISTQDTPESRAMAINDEGTVVGDAATESSGREVHAFAWDGDAVQDLGIPDHESGATGINSAGLIVGYERDRRFDVANLDEPARQIVGSTLTGAADEHAAIWQDGSLHDLNNTIDAGDEWVLVRATAINDAGQVVGLGTLQDQERAFILTPCS